MIDVRNLESASGLNNCFEFLFDYKSYFQTDMAGNDGVSIQNECDYFLWLFTKHKVLMGEKKQLIWSLHWECELNGIPFTMVYDEDYGTVSFSVSKEHIADIDNLSRTIIDMINQEASRYCDGIH